MRRRLLRSIAPLVGAAGILTGIAVSAAPAARALAPLPAIVPSRVIAGILVEQIVVDPTGRFLYGSVPGHASRNQKQIARIELASAHVDLLSVGGVPTRLAIADDGSQVYAIVDHAAVVQIDVARWSVVRRIETTGSSDQGFPIGPTDVDVLPGHPASIVVATGERVFDRPPSQPAGVAVYDNGVRRDRVTSGSIFHVYSGWNEPTQLSIDADGRRAVGIGAGGMVEYSIDDRGIEATAYHPLLIGRYMPDQEFLDVPVWVGHRLVDMDGGVIDTDTWAETQLGQATGYSLGNRVRAAAGRGATVATVNVDMSRLRLTSLDHPTVTDQFSIDVGYGTTIARSMAALPDGRFVVSTYTIEPGTGYTGALWVLDPLSMRGAAGEFTPLTPTRILDTRSGVGCVRGRLGPGATVRVPIAGYGGVPASGVGAVVLNVTGVGATAETYLTIWPTGVGRPDVSNVNLSAGDTTANLATVPLGADGSVTLFNAAGTTDVIFDVSGFYATASGPAGARFHGVTPTRLLDTRSGIGGTSGPVGATPIRLRVAGARAVPMAAVGVVLNVTITDPSAATYLTVFPSDVGQPEVSNLNVPAGATRPNLVVVRVPPSGTVDIANAFGSTHVIADVVGYYDLDRTSERGRLVTFTPYRWFDSRVDKQLFGGDGRLNNGNVLVLGELDTWVNGYVFNVTVTAAEGTGYVTAYPDGAVVPNASNVNFVSGQTVPNHVIVENGPRVDLVVRNGRVHLIVDVFGAFT